jgi:aspartyl-tRNA(Asn)/glutamyl-tRNA(Gln) amidotransferase subunit C
MNKEEVKKLALLSRLNVSEGELEALSEDLNNILKFVKEIEGAQVDNGSQEKSEIQNVVREDSDPHESGKWSEKILDSAPKRKGDYIEVKKIM